MLATARCIRCKWINRNRWRIERAYKKIEHKTDICFQIPHLLFLNTHTIHIYRFLSPVFIGNWFFFAHPHAHKWAAEFCNWKTVFGIRLQNKTKLEMSNNNNNNLIHLRCFASMPMPIHFAIFLYRLTNFHAVLMNVDYWFVFIIVFSRNCLSLGISIVSGQTNRIASL